MCACERCLFVVPWLFGGRGACLLVCVLCVVLFCVVLLCVVVLCVVVLCLVCLSGVFGVWVVVCLDVACVRVHLLGCVCVRGCLVDCLFVGVFVCCFFDCVFLCVCSLFVWLSILFGIVRSFSALCCVVCHCA